MDTEVSKNILILQLLWCLKFKWKLPCFIFCQRTTECAILHSEKVSCCRRNVMSGDWCVVIYDIQNILLIPVIVSCTTNMCLWHESACFFQIAMHYFKYISVRLSLIWMLIFPECREGISITKAKQEMHICILHISKSRRICCLHCSCY